MFSREHLDAIRAGEKTQTRRIWSDNYTARPSAGDYRMATPSDLGPIVSHEECDCYIRILECDRQALGNMTPEDADAEGGYTLSEFQHLWEWMHGEEAWDVQRVVDRVEFEYVGTEHPERVSDGDSPSAVTSP